MTPNAYGHCWPQQDRPPPAAASSSSHLDRTENLADCQAYDSHNDPQYAYSDYAEPRTPFDPFAGAVWVPDPPPPPLLPTLAPTPAPYYGSDLYYQRLNFGPPPLQEEEEERGETPAVTPLTPTTAYQTATAAAEIPYHHQRYPAPPQYSYEHFQRYPLAASEYPGADDHPQQQYAHVDKRPRFDEDPGAPGTFTSLSGYRTGGGGGDPHDQLSSSSYFHLPISSDPPPRPPIPMPTPIPITDSEGGGGRADPSERRGSSAIRWYRPEPLLPPRPPPQPGPAAHFPASHVEPIHTGNDNNSGDGRGEHRPGGGGGGARGRATAPASAQQQQQQQRPSLATLSSGSNSTLGSATTVSSSSFSSTSLSSVAPNPTPHPPSGSPLAPPAAVAATGTRPQQQQQNGPSLDTPQQHVPVPVDHHPGGIGHANESEQLRRNQGQSHQTRERGGGMMSPSSQLYQTVPPASAAAAAATPAQGQNQSKKTQVSKSEKSCKACRSVFWVFARLSALRS